MLPSAIVEYVELVTGDGSEGSRPITHTHSQGFVDLNRKPLHMDSFAAFADTFWSLLKFLYFLRFRSMLLNLPQYRWKLGSFAIHWFDRWFRRVCDGVYSAEGWRFVCGYLICMVNRRVPEECFIVENEGSRYAHERMAVGQRAGMWLRDERRCPRFPKSEATKCELNVPISARGSWYFLAYSCWNAEAHHVTEQRLYGWMNLVRWTKNSAQNIIQH